MKKHIILIMLTLCMTLLIGCGKFNNEIYNRSYDVDITIDDLAEGFSFAIEKVSDAIVGVTVHTKNSQLVKYKQASSGSGVVYECLATMKDGEQVACSQTKDSSDVKKYTYKLVTNRHVVDCRAKFIKYSVYLGDINQTVDAKVLGVCSTIDLAVLSFDTSKYIEPIEFADSNDIKSGVFVIAIGNPNGEAYYDSATLGIVSYPKRYMKIDTNNDGIDDYDTELIQHDAAINPGNSGGALINLKGQLLGINTLKIVDSEVDNMGFAISVNLVKQHIPYLERGEQLGDLSLGITATNVDLIINRDIYEDTVINIPMNVTIPSEIEYGIYVTNVNYMSSVYQLIKPNDILLEINGHKLYRTNQIPEILSNSDGEINFAIYRDGKYQNISYII